MIFSRSILLFIAIALISLVNGAPVDSTNSKKNIIFMVPDGLAPTASNLARFYKMKKDNLTEYDLTFDQYLVGTIRTHSASSLITDSAAAGTAFAIGHKTFNGAIGVDADKTPRGTIMEALKELGYTTGLVVTTKITDATPAVFAAHVESRKQENEIAEQYLSPLIGGRTVDLLVGGGRCHFTPQSAEGSCRKDDNNLIAQAQDQGWTYIGEKSQFDQATAENVNLPLMAFFADEKMNYEIDRKESEQPSLAQMAKFSLELLAEKTKDSEQGFFVMIESSRIDHTGHDNDAVAMGPEILAFDEAWQVAKDFVDNAKDDTILISVADHETGGVSLAYDDQPSWYPEYLTNKTHSSEYLVKELEALNETSADNETITNHIRHYFTTEMGLDDVAEEEFATILDELKADGSPVHAISKIHSDRAAVGFTTGGHSNAFVNLYGYTNNDYFQQAIEKKGEFEGFGGNHDNTEVPKFFAKLTGADMDAITEKLKQ